MQSSSRNGARVRVLCLHTTEGIMRATDLRAWTGWAGSSHAAADETGVLLDGADDGFVDHDRASWTLRSGNPWSENIELCGFAKWTRAQWLARPKLLEAAAIWLARRSQARRIPLRKLTPAEYRAGASGVIEHNDHTVGYRDGTHWDVGPGFPWDVVIARARQIVAGIETEDPDMAALFDTRVDGRNVFDWFKQLRAEHNAQTAALSGQVAGLTAAVSTLARGVDGVDGDELKQHISAEVDRAMAEFRERVAEGYDVRLEPKSDDA